MEFKLKTITNTKIAIENNYGVQLFLKREDTIHPFVSGNKYRKLKYNIEKAAQVNKKTLLTFGGAFSNHIAATAAIGKMYGFKTIGVIRGEELVDKIESNATLKYAKSCGMIFKFVTRTDYRKQKDFLFIEALKAEYGDFYCIPEGGTNSLAVRGCEEILNKADSCYNYICVPVGTGGTISGLINCSKPSQQVLGFSALKGSFLKEDISKFATQDNWQLITNYHFGGYAKFNNALITFINKFKLQNTIQLDPIYTGKMMYGIFDMINKGYFEKGSKILAIHTGGIQGITGVNSILRKKAQPLIQ